MMLGRAHHTVTQHAAVAWTERGSGPPLVLLHGLADSHRTWRRVVKLLAPKYRVLMPDLPGHGLSARPDAPYTLTWYADTLAAWMDAIGLERAHFCGHSFGGGVAQWMLLHHRRRVDRLALVAPGGLGTEVTPALRLAALPWLAPLLVSPLFGLSTGLLMRAAQRFFACPERDEIARLTWLNSAPRAGLAFHRTVVSCIGLRGQHVQTWDHVRGVEALPPIALFWGTRDSVIPVAHAYRAQARLTGVALHAYQCGHFPHLESAPRFAADLRGFLEAATQPARLRGIGRAAAPRSLHGDHGVDAPATLLGDPSAAA